MAADVERMARERREAEREERKRATREREERERLAVERLAAQRRAERENEEASLALARRLMAEDAAAEGLLPAAALEALPPPRPAVAAPRSREAVVAALADWIATQPGRTARSCDIPKFFKAHPELRKPEKGYQWLTAKLLASQGLSRRPGNGYFIIECAAGTDSFSEPGGDDDQTCAVCMDRVPDHRVDCPAEHQFCLSCIREWFDRLNTSCPTCKRDVTGAFPLVQRAAATVRRPPRQPVPTPPPARRQVVSPETTPATPAWGNQPPPPPPAPPAPPPPPPPPGPGDSEAAKNRAMAELLRSLDDFEQRYAQLFEDNMVTIDCIAHLEREDWRELGVPIGHKSRIISRVRELHPDLW